mmetsp:Transcript_6021/g.9836  ORF Transcript_6021/g.9836 Transcript_6021/m.9836 type:complete len:279 (-) Transcript_6021:169-1005(-)
MKKNEDAVLLKDQISSYFETIQSKKDGNDDQKKIGFSVGSTSTTTDVRGNHRTASSATTRKTALFSSQCGDAAPPMTVEEEKASAAARCLAILGVASSATPQALPTKEEIIKSRKQREQEIMEKSAEIQRIEEENRNRRPLIWDKPTFCPFGGETKSDELEESSSKKRKITENCSTLQRQSSSSSILPSTDPCSSLLSKTSSKRNRHDNLFPYNMFGMPRQSSATVGMDWSKETVDSFVEFTDKMIKAAGKKKRKHEGTTSSTSLLLRRKREGFEEEK